MSMQLYLVLALLFALLVAVFAVQNTMTVQIAFLFWQFKVSLVLVILGAASFGALCVFLVGMFKNLGTWRKNRELENKNKLLNEKVKELEEKINQTIEKDNQEIDTDGKKDSNCSPG
jgi:uncharacterized integral membrane protein